MASRRRSEKSDEEQKQEDFERRMEGHLVLSHDDLSETTPEEDPVGHAQPPTHGGGPDADGGTEYAQQPLMAELGFNTVEDEGDAWAGAEQGNKTTEADSKRASEAKRKNAAEKSGESYDASHEGVDKDRLAVDGDKGKEGK